MCSLFRLPGRSIAPFAINSRCFCVAISSRFQVPGFVLKTSFSVPGSPGSRFAVLNLNSGSSGLIHLFLRHVVISNLLGLLHLLLGSLPLRRQLRSLPLRLLLLPLLSLVLLLFVHLLPAPCCWCCCCCCCCRRYCCCCCGGRSQQVPDEVVSQACNESPAGIVDDRVFRKLATLN